GVLFSGAAESYFSTSPPGVVCSWARATMDICSVAEPAASTADTCQRRVTLPEVRVSVLVPPTSSLAVVRYSILYSSTWPLCQRQLGAWAATRAPDNNTAASATACPTRFMVGPLLARSGGATGRPARGV